MNGSKFGIYRRRGLWVCLLALIAFFFISGMVLADSDLPADPPESTEASLDGVDGVEDPIDVSGLDEAADGEEGDAESGEAGGESADEGLPADAGSADDEGAAEPADEAPETQVDDPLSSEEDAGEVAAGDETVEVPGEDLPSPEIVDEDAAGILAEADIEIVNPDGETVADGAAQAGGSDPYWKVGTIWYSVVADEGDCYTGTSVAAGTCWVSSIPITMALQKIESGLLPSDRKLYLDGTFSDEGGIVISGVYQNQLNGLIGTGRDTTSITGTITLDGNTGGFTFSGFSIWGSIIVENCSGTLTLTDVVVREATSDGLVVGLSGGSPAHAGAVTISGSTFIQNNESAAQINATSTVTITNSMFNDNGASQADHNQYGLYINTTGVINLNGVKASGNYGQGLTINGYSALTIKNVVASDNISYTNGSHNYFGDGIYIYSSVLTSAKVSLENVQADNNDHIGIYIMGLGVVTLKNVQTSSNGDMGLGIATSNSVTINTALALENGKDGIIINGGKTVTLSSITSSNNGAHGLLVTGWGATYPTLVTLTSSKSGGPVTANFFEDNASIGLEIYANGQITLTNLDASRNSDDGIILDNCLLDDDSGLCTGKGNVTINMTTSNWMNSAEDNGGYGIWIRSKGVVSISQTSVSGNAYDGFYVDTQGAIKLDQCNASGNDNNGAYLVNLSAPKAQTVTITDSVFDDNEGMGVYVLTAGAINFKGSSASSNHSPTGSGIIHDSVTLLDTFYSVSLFEDWDFYVISGQEMDIIVKSDDFQSLVSVYNNNFDLIASESGNYTENGYTRITFTAASSGYFHIYVSYSGVFEGVGFYNLSLNDVDETNPAFPGSGAVFNNSAGKAPVNVSSSTNSGPSVFADNHEFGLKVFSNGNITIASASATGNDWAGLSLDNPGSAGVVNIVDKSKIPSSSYSQNGWGGITVNTLGNILMTSITADDNDWQGIVLNNCQYDGGLGACLGKGIVTINKVSAQNNGDSGLDIFTAGNVSLNVVDSSSNGSFGITINNRLGIGNVTLRSITASSNNNTGLNVVTNGLVNLSAITANDNFKTTGYLNIGGAVSDYFNADVSADQWGFDASNGETYTIRLYASDNPAWDVNAFIGNLTLTDDEGNPLSFDSVIGAGTNALTATWTASENGYFILYVSENSGNNGYYRLSIDNETFSDMAYYNVDGVYIEAAKNVSFTGKIANNINHNSQTGLSVDTLGNISLLNVRTISNGTDGALLNNSAGTGLVNVNGIKDTIRGSFNMNGWSGLTIMTTGTINLNFVTAMFNGSDGLSLNNTSALYPRAVTAKNLNLFNNGGNGLIAFSIGNVTLSNINAQGNGMIGVSVDCTSGSDLLRVTVSGENYFWNSGSAGLAIETHGLALISGVDVRSNDDYGVWVVADKGITFSKSYVRDSTQSGIYLESYMPVLVTNVASFNNGEPVYNGAGLIVMMHNNAAATIKSSAFMNNVGYGVLGYFYVDDLGPKLIMIDTVCIGNDTDNDGDPESGYFYFI